MKRTLIHAAALAAASLALAGTGPAVAQQLRQAPTQPDWSWQPTPPVPSQPPPAPTYGPGAQAYGRPAYEAGRYGGQPGQPYSAGGTAATGAPAGWQHNAYSSYSAPPAERPTTYSSSELIDQGHAFFGAASSGLAEAIQSVLTRFGEPNAYVLGEEGSGAIVGGLRYGEGTLYVAGGERPLYWQGPSVGWDFGGSGSRVMMLVYDLPSPETMLQRFTGVDGSAYLVGGASVTMMAANQTYLIPVRTGVGARLGVSLGYLKFTDRPTWNPF